jgi:hypothetical protein
MRRHIVTAALLFSLPSCAASLVLWAWSHTGAGQVTYVSDARRYVLDVGGGQFAFQVTEDGNFRLVRQGMRSQWRSGRDHANERRLWNRLFVEQHSRMSASVGVWCGSIPNGGPAPVGTTWIVVGPVWLVSAALAIPAAVCVANGRRDRRKRDRLARGLCPSCGYDSRATPDRCPECGARPAAP